MNLRKVMGREPYRIPIVDPLIRLADERVLVTGGNGSLGPLLTAQLLRAGIAVRTTDIEDMDVRDWLRVKNVFNQSRPTVVFHLAGAKQAPDGEIDPEQTTETNVYGTANVVGAADNMGAKVVLASTCKACEPETVYGATKLIAERIVLNAGGGVARFFNVVDTAGNVFDFWKTIPDGEPIPVTPCTRYFVCAEEAIALLLWTWLLDTGRYTVMPGFGRYMPDVAHDLYPDRPQTCIPPRRGDRTKELYRSRSEQNDPSGGPSPIARINGNHDYAKTDDEIWHEWWNKSRAVA